VTGLTLEDVAVWLAGSTREAPRSLRIRWTGVSYAVMVRRGASDGEHRDITTYAAALEDALRAAMGGES
jgi:hypothetical protein